MKMARASETDLKVALDVSRIIEDLECGYLPPESEDADQDYFNEDNAEHCQRAIKAILRAAERGSIFRVTFGMAVILDPRNEILNPNADTLDLHPRIAAALVDAERYRWLRQQDWFSGPLAVVRDPKQAIKLGHDLPSLDRLDAAIDRARGAE